VITAVDGMAISGMVGLMTEIRAAPIGTSVDLTIVRSAAPASDPASTVPASTQPAGAAIEEGAVLKLTVLLTARPER
jgi:S1-C subfamily serine protease